MTSNGRTIFQNTRRALRVRILSWGMVAAGLAGLFATQDIYLTYGLAPGDGGLLKPWSERVVFAGILGAICLVTIFGAIALSARYVSQICESRTGRHGTDRTLEVTTVGLIGRRTRTYPRLGATWRKYSGVLVTTGTRAPYLLFRPAATRVPYIIDLQAEQVTLSALRG